eukprot:8253841-Pyramimonas_sp.AAC.1
MGDGRRGETRGGRERDGLPPGRGRRQERAETGHNGRAAKVELHRVATFSAAPEPTTRRSVPASSCGVPT